MKSTAVVQSLLSPYPLLAFLFLSLPPAAMSLFLSTVQKPACPYSRFQQRLPPATDRFLGAGMCQTQFESWPG